MDRAGGTAKFRILGPIELSDGTGLVSIGGPRQLALLAFLLVNANRAVSTDQLIDSLWGEQRASGALKRLQVAVARLRKALDGADGAPDGGRLRTVRGGYLLFVAPDELDADIFQARIREGHAMLDAGRAADAAGLLREALALWRGPPLAEVAFEDFARSEVRRLEELHLRALELALDAELAVGRHREVLGEIEALVAAEPMRERLRAQHMLALYRSGRQADALAAFHEMRRILLAELGVEPGPDLQRLHEAILRHDPSLELEAAVDEFPAALEAAAAGPLVGRSEELRQLRERWNAVREENRGALVAIVGGRGMGKTRLAAELAAEARRDGGVVWLAHGVDDSAAIADACEARRPSLLVVEDLDRAGAYGFDALQRLAAERPVLVVVCTEDPWRIRAETTVVLKRLDADAVAEIARLYSTTEPLSATRLASASEGVPGRVHELAGEWAREDAARRVDATAGRAAAGRSALRGLQVQLAENVVDFEAARDRLELLTGGADRAIVLCPFKGLAAFEFDDAEYFFGRERLVAELVARTVGASLLGVVGPSGSGKSSVVRAGLMPALAGGVLPGSGFWERRVIRPGEHPLRELERTTEAVDGKTRLVLAVDQFEETFTVCRDEIERQASIDELVRIAGSGLAVVVLAVRADFYGRCATYPELSELIGANHVLVGPMRRDELRRAIERPAERAGLQVEPALIDALVSDVESAPGGLPLLSTALLELWRHRDHRRLHLAAYERSGGIREAVARLAEEAYGQLPPAEQAIARRLLLRLAADDGTGAVVRRRVPMAELEDAASVAARLADQRLLTIGDGAVEVAHEALLREWPRLRRWLDEDEHGRRTRRHLSDAAREWDQRGREHGDLYRGSRLASALEWRTEHEHELGPTERAFLDAGRAAQEREVEAMRRRTRRRRALVLGLSVLALIALVSAALAVRQTQRAESERRVAVSRSLATQAQSQLDQNLDLAALLSLEAYLTEPTFEARTALLGVLPSLAHAAGRLEGHSDTVRSVAFSPDGKILASAGADGAVRLWDPATRRPLGPQFHDPSATFVSLAFSGDGKTLAVVSDEGVVILWDVDRWEPLHKNPLLGPSGDSASVTFSPDGNTVVLAAGGSVRAWDVATGRALARPLTGLSGAFPRVAFSADGRTLAALDDRERKVMLWDLAARRTIGEPLRTTGVARGVAVSADGAMLATAADDGSIQLWDPASRRPLGKPLESRVRDASLLAFSPDGAILAVAGGADGAVRLWDVAARRQLGEPLDGHRNAVASLAFSADGRTLATGGSEDRTVRLWHIVAARPLSRALDADDGPVTEVALSFDGKVLASAGASGRIRLWDPATRRPLGQPLEGHHEAVVGAAFSPVQPLLATISSYDRTIRLWDLSSRPPIGRTFKDLYTSGFDVAFSGDGKMVASGLSDGTARLWDLDGRPLGQPVSGQPVTARSPAVYRVAFSPDSKMLATGGAADGTVLVWDVARAQALGQPLEGHAGPITGLAFSPDGTTLASASADQTVRLWDSLGSRLLGQPLRYTSALNGVAFSADGKTLATSADDGTVQLWDLAARRPLGQPLAGHRGPVAGVAFGADGRTLASAGAGDGTVRVWDPILWSDDLRALQSTVCAAVGHNLSRAEWSEFLPGDPYRETCP